MEKKRNILSSDEERVRIKRGKAERMGHLEERTEENRRSMGERERE